jgi:cell division protein FtsZ
MAEPGETLEMPLVLKEEVAPVADPVRREQPFIPPRPVEPALRTAPTAGKADPFAEAALANGGGEMGRRPGRPAASAGRGLSLFERMTGGRARQRRAQEMAISQPQIAQGQPAATANSPQPPAMTAAPAAKPAADAPVQPRLGGLDAKERVNVKAGEDDLLDIPAFLRRQAN